MSSDNRTNAIIQQRVANTQPNLRQASRKCSFCRCTGHTVNQCNDGRFMIFEVACIQQKCQIQNLSTNDVFVSPSQEFINRLILYAIGNTARMIKYYAVRKCGAVMRNNIFTCIEKVSIYIFNLNDEANYLLNDPTFQSNNWYTMIREAGLLDLTGTLQSMVTTKFKIESILDLTCDNEGEISCDSECAICYESKIETEFVKLNCSHIFCGKCIENTLKTCTSPRCAFCRESIKSILSKDVNITNGLSEYILA
jgi:hypothetical protein